MRRAPSFSSESIARKHADWLARQPGQARIKQPLPLTRRFAAVVAQAEHVLHQCRRLAGPHVPTLTDQELRALEVAVERLVDEAQEAMVRRFFSAEREAAREPHPTARCRLPGCGASLTLTQVRTGAQYHSQRCSIEARSLAARMRDAQVLQPRP